MSAAVPQTKAELAYGGVMLPHARMEDWRWTNLRTLIDKPYPPRIEAAASPAEIERLLKSSPFARIAGARIVFVNGRYDAAHSRFAGLTLTPGLAPARADGPIVSLNKAFATEGVHLHLDGTADTPVEIVHIATAGEARTLATRNVIEIAANASATVIETHLGAGEYLTNAVSEIIVNEGARLDRIKIELEASDAIHLSHALVTLKGRATLRDFTLTSGARVNRQNGNYVFEGEGADARISGAYLLAGKQHADTRLVVEHRVPKCVSREMFKCVMDGNARGIFQGKVVVARDAQKTDGKQSSHALLLSDTAEFDAKPELEIFADDVVCGHGATSGDIDHNHLFYLRSRGIPEPTAKSMLIAAFVGEAFEHIDHDGIRAELERFAENWLTDHERPAA
ncbi:MAG: Fe-S cluster assembly protein SufD [Parvibaculaceae bacterium]